VADRVAASRVGAIPAAVEPARFEGTGATYGHFKFLARRDHDRRGDLRSSTASAAPAATPARRAQHVDLEHMDARRDDEQIGPH